MKKETFIDAVSEIDADIISEVSQEREAADNVLSAAKKRRMRRILSLAACFAVVFTAIFTVRYAVIYNRYCSGETIIDSEAKGGGFGFGAQKPSAPSMPWDTSIYKKLYMKDRSYAPGESGEIFLELAMKDALLGEGEIIVEIGNSREFTMSINGIVTENGSFKISDFSRAGYSEASPLRISVSLAPIFSERWASGCLTLSVRFAFYDLDGFLDRIENNGAGEGELDEIRQMIKGESITLINANISYAADRLETRFASSSSYGTLFEQLICDHLDTWRISRREFADLYYEHAYGNNIFASITSYIESEQTFRFEYHSRNIRYEMNDYISDPEIWSCFLELQALERSAIYNDPPELTVIRRKMGELILRRLLTTGVITEEEYFSELEWMKGARVGNAQPGYGSNLSRYRRILHHYRCTHK
ncbi:MAG: hypothetical protein IJY04_09640 [Clostridia bacterium]|nr:hypothetical protein [Clostridia bacterium]